MSAAITLPGAIPGLLRRGSPCLFRDGDGPITLHVANYERDEFMGGVGRDYQHSYTNGAEAAGLLLDLTDATGRAHAAWWLRDWMENDEKAGAPNTALLTASERNRARMLVQMASGGRADAGLLRRVVLHVAGLPVSS